MVAIGLAALAYTAWQVAETAHFLSRAARAEGTVAEASPHPLIRFETAEGVPVRFRQNGFVSRPEGASVPVAYDPRDPAGTARAATFWPTWGTALWMLPAGLGFTILPLLGARVGIRGRPDAP